jgi:hypothetical protein
MIIAYALSGVIFVSIGLNVASFGMILGMILSVVF